MTESGQLTSQIRQLTIAATAADAEKQKLLDRLNIIASSKSGLDEEKKFLADRLADATELAKTEKQNAAQLTTQLADSEQRIKSLIEELNSVRKERSDMNDDLSQQTLITRKTEVKLQAAHTELSQQKGVIAALEQTVANFKSEKKSVDEASAAARKVMREFGVSESERKRIELECDALKEQLTQQTAAREALKQTLAGFDEQQISIQSKLKALSDEKSQLITLNDELRSELKEQRTVESKLRTEISTFTQTITTLKSERVELAASLQRLDHQSGSRSDAAVRANQRVTELKAEKDALSAALEQANAHIRYAHTQCIVLCFVVELIRFY